MNGASGEEEKREFAKFKQWLFSLNQQELLNSMQFTFQTSLGTNESHECDLLMEMVKLQTPTETPVHPRALGYKPRSQFGPQLDYERGKVKSRWTKPRMFQWSERQSYRPKGGRRSRPQRRFDVIARNKVAPWGEVYSLGSTRDQRDEDRRILEGTFLEQCHEGERKALFRDKGSARSIIGMLQIVSRGCFLKPQVISSSSFFTGWLQPTERWFSLSFYLASRYQVSLWESFISTQTSRVTAIRSQPSTEYESKILQVAIPNAVRTGLRNAMESDRQKLDYIRDSIIWNVLTTRCISYGGDEWNDVWKSWKQVPLLQIDKPIFMLQSLVRNSLEHALVQEMEKSLLNETLNDPLPSNKVKKKKKRNKHKKNKKVVTRPLEESGGANEISSEDEVENNGDNTVVTHSIDFPNNETSPQSRNRNIIFALTILDEIVENVFLEVGLEATPKAFNDEEKNGKRKEKGEADTKYFRGLKRKDPQKSAFHVPTKNGIHQNGSVEVDNNGNLARLHLAPSFDKDSLPSQVVTTDLSLSQSSLPTDFYRPVGLEDFSFGRTTDEDVLDGWPFANRYQSRERSILTDFFRAQEDKSDDDEKLMAASTAASISSSTYKDSTFVADAEEIEKGPQDEPAFASEMLPIREDDNSLQRQNNTIRIDDTYNETEPKNSLNQSNSLVPAKEIAFGTSSDRVEGQEKLKGESFETIEASSASSSSSNQECRSPSPQAPITPPPTLSPILLSLEDLKDLKNLSLTPQHRTGSDVDNISRRFSDAPLPGSLPSSPVHNPKNGLTPSWSREDLRMAAFRDDHNITRRPKKVRQPQPFRPVDFQQSYKSVATKSLAKPIAASKSGNVDFRTQSVDFRSHVLESSKRDPQRDFCAQSETAVEGQREDHQWHHDLDNKSFVKDETTTITSALSHREPEDIVTIREERNSFRDMCLTLGAEVARLKAMLAAQTATAVAGPFDYPDGFNQPLYRPGSFDPNGMPPFFHGMKRGKRLGAMSDAGLHRAGDHESQVSEEEAFDVISKVRNDAARRMSATATQAGSDVSIEFNTSVIQVGPLGKVPGYDASTVTGLQSRLTKDILRYLSATKTQLKKLDVKREMAIERFSRLVNTLWPRAQVKLYGSHESGLCLPSSDLDFVICLPAVHKNAPALAPGVLEGRNAINESSQKLLARELKGESWIDPRSIKLIERTVVPVIKVSTKDTKARMIQLDISFDSPEHHGLEAVEMVRKILEELPLIRPLMLVLKQFLLDRGLLTAYTGGLSSYCLFLMLARYLQEQPSSFGDCGSLLMGFLDYYGNFFDPRATGISVRRRQYFVRPNYAVASYQTAGQGLWTPPPSHQQHVNPTSSASADFLRRNSFSDAGSLDGVRRAPSSRQHRLSSTHRYVSHNVPHSDEMHGRPFTFDPLFVEDPLSSRNNVGRNAFRIFQVQRAFSDAHRALVASLEWDIHSSGELNEEVDYPLLKCLLHSEDVLYEL